MSTTSTTPSHFYPTIEAARMAGNGNFKSGNLDAAVTAYTQGMLDLYPASLVACSIPGVVHCEKQLGLVSEEDVALLYNINPTTTTDDAGGEATTPTSTTPTSTGILAPSSLVQSTTSSAAMRPLELLEEFNKCCGNACMSLYKKGNINTTTTQSSNAALHEYITTAMKIVVADEGDSSSPTTVSPISILKSMATLVDTHHSKKTSTTASPPLSVFIEDLVVITTSIVRHHQYSTTTTTTPSSSSASQLANTLLHIVCTVLNISPSQEEGCNVVVDARVDCVQLAATGILENPFLAKAHAFLGAAAGEVLALTTSVLVLMDLLPIPSSSSQDTSISHRMRRALMTQVVIPVTTKIFKSLFNLPAVDGDAVMNQTPSTLLNFLLQGHFVRALNTAHQHLSIAMTLLPELVPQPPTTPTNGATSGKVFSAYLTPFDAYSGGEQQPQHFPYTGNVAKGMFIIGLASTLCQLASATTTTSTPLPASGSAEESSISGGVGGEPMMAIEPPFIIPGLVSSSLHSLSGNGVVFSPPPTTSSSSSSASSSLCSVLPAGKVVAELVFPDSISSYLDPDVVLELDKVTADDERVATSLCQCCGISLSDAVIRKKNAGTKISSSSPSGDDGNHIWGCMACRMVAFCSASCVSKYNATTASTAADRHTLFECARYRKLREMFRQITEGNDRFAQGAGGRQTDVPDNFLDVAAHTISTLSAIEAEAEDEKQRHTTDNETNKVTLTGGGARKKRRLLEALEGHDAEVAQSTLPLVPLICQLLNASRGDSSNSGSSSSYPVSEATIAHIVGVVLCNSMEVLNEEEEDNEQHQQVAASGANEADNVEVVTSLTTAMPPFYKPLKKLTTSMFDSPDAFGGKGIACGQVLFLNALSHLNHSCRPNCATTTTTASGKSSSTTIVRKCVQTLRPIFPGEELTISYIPSLYAAPKRRSELLTERFYFTCRCPACSGSTTSSSLKNIGSNNNSTTTAELTTRGGISWSHVFATAAISQESRKKMQAQVHQLAATSTAGEVAPTPTTTTKRNNVAVGTLLAKLVACSSSSTLLELLLSSSASSPSHQHQDLLLLLMKALTNTAASTLPPLPTTSQTARLKKSHEVARQDTISVSYVAAAWAAAQTTADELNGGRSESKGEDKGIVSPTTSSHFIASGITNKYYSHTDLYQALSSAEKPPANTNNHRPPGERTTLYFNRAQVLCSGIRERSVQEILEDPTFFKNSNSSSSPKKSVINTIVPPGMRTVLVELTSFRAELNRHLHPYNHAVQDVRNTTTFALSVLSSHILSLARREIVDVIAKSRLPAPSSSPAVVTSTPSDYLGAAYSNVVVYIAAACLVTTSAVLSTLNELLLWNCLTPDDTFPVKLDKRQNVVHAQNEIIQLLLEMDVMCKELDGVTVSSPSSKEVIASLLQDDASIKQLLREVRKAIGSVEEEDDGLGATTTTTTTTSQQLPSLALMRWLLSSS